MSQAPPLHRYQATDEQIAENVRLNRIQRANDEAAALRIVPQPKPVSGGTLPHGSKDQEIENLKRLLANVSQRLDALKAK